MRESRNRFVAFSFATADLLLELDGEGRVCYALGAGMALVGRNCEDMIGTFFTEYFRHSEGDFLRHLVVDADAGQRIGPIVLPSAPGLPSHGMVVSGCRLPDDPSRIYIALSEANFANASQPFAASRDPETGLLDREAFQHLARETLATAKALDQDVRLTLLAVPELGAFERRLGAVKASSFIQEIGRILRGKAINHAGGRLSADRFGLVHDAALPVSAIEAKLVAAARSIGPKHAGLAVMSTTLAVEDALSDEDAGRALGYAVVRFARGESFETMPQTLGAALKLVMVDALARIQHYRSLISEQRLRLVGQPVINLETSRVHHYEVLLRLEGDYSPYEVVTFAEEVGLIPDLDFAVCELAARHLNRSDMAQPLKLAVNLSGHSITNATFVARLLRLLTANRSLGGRLLFEITESARITDLAGVNQVIAGLRRLNHEVCLDDFGAGAASFQYLSALDVDYVKIDGKYVREAGESRRNAVMLKAIATLCADLNIKTVAEMVETAEQVKLMTDLGVGYAQGHYFGRPVILNEIDPRTALNPALRALS